MHRCERCKYQRHKCHMVVSYFSLAQGTLQFHVDILISVKGCVSLFECSVHVLARRLAGYSQRTVPWFPLGLLVTVATCSFPRDRQPWLFNWLLSIIATRATCRISVITVVNGRQFILNKDLNKARTLFCKRLVYPCSLPSSGQTWLAIRSYTIVASRATCRTRVVAVAHIGAFIKALNGTIELLDYRITLAIWLSSVFLARRRTKRTLVP